MTKKRTKTATQEQLERLHALVVKHLLASFETGKPTIQDMAGATAILKKAGLASNNVGRPPKDKAEAHQGAPGGPVSDDQEDGGLEDGPGAPSPAQLAARRPMLLDPGIKLPFPG